MDNFFKNLKDKLSFDNLFGLLKDSKVAQNIAHDEVKKTLEKLDPRNFTSDEIKAKVSDVAEHSKQIIGDISSSVLEDSSKGTNVKIIDTAKAGLNVLQKSNENLKHEETENEDNSNNDGEDIDPVWDI